MLEPIVYTTIDKAKRDELYRELRARGVGVERQVVKFSGCQPVLGEDGQQLKQVKTRRTRFIETKKHKTVSREVEIVEIIPVWQSSWSVAHPAEIDTIEGSK